ncbi:VOC family protein [Kribbella capetownensis]|uniref:VOC family protein n=1 Tax=Kribbella capetownensis TaxID=1572659 RepID=A0A4R0JJ42_9ACTN|nr:VOC family protein [Kribbella capetownensis]TCC45744.1 VOC family protein [Kribbella capetownensis]
MTDRPSTDEDRSTSSLPVPVIDAVAFDASDPDALSRFWQSLLGGELRPAEDGVIELHGAAVRLDFVQVPEAKQAKNRQHLDLYVPPATRNQSIEHAVALGASRADDIYDGGLWQCLRDPEGNEFCLVWGAGTPSTSD